MYYSITNSRFPYSEIPGSKLTYSSPRHIGVSPVLHRLLVPRHPPCALIHLTNDYAMKKLFHFILLMSCSYLVFKVQTTTKGGYFREITLSKLNIQPTCVPSLPPPL